MTDLHIFDLDETLIAGDSSSLFCEFMCEQGWMDKTSFLAEEARLMDLYHKGELLMEDYVNLQVEPLKAFSKSLLDTGIQTFVTQVMLQKFYPQAIELIKRIKQQGDEVLVISATVAFLVKPIAALLEINNVLAIDLVMDEDDMPTSTIKGHVSYREGKVLRLKEWLAEQEGEFENSHFYSDSINDLSLLEYVDFPIVTNPDAKLTEIANQKAWPILDWRRDQALSTEILRAENNEN